MKWLIVFALLMPNPVLAKVVPLKLDRFSLAVGKLGLRDPMLPEIMPDQWQYYFATEFDLSVYKYIYWENRVHGETAYSKFMSVAWEYELGLRPNGWFDLFWRHHSRHTLDIEQPTYYDRITKQNRKLRFPVEDVYGIRFNFIGGK